MKRKLLLFAALGLQTLAHAVSRFPKPDFESGYQYPEVSYAIPHEHLWNVVDVVLLVVLLGVVAWAVYKNRTRVPIIITSVISIAYFGFFRGGCVCSIGSIQNVALAMVDEYYHLPWVVLMFFLIPIIFAFFFGRVLPCFLPLPTVVSSFASLTLSSASSDLVEIQGLSFLVWHSCSCRYSRDVRSADSSVLTEHCSVCFRRYRFANHKLHRINA